MKYLVFLLFFVALFSCEKQEEMVVFEYYQQCENEPYTVDTYHISKDDVTKYFYDYDCNLYCNKCNIYETPVVMYRFEVRRRPKCLLKPQGTSWDVTERHLEFMSEKYDCYDHSSCLECYITNLATGKKWRVE